MLACTGRQSRASRSAIWPLSQEISFSRIFSNYFSFPRIFSIFLEKSKIFSRKKNSENPYFLPDHGDKLVVIQIDEALVTNHSTGLKWFQTQLSEVLQSSVAPVSRCRPADDHIPKKRLVCAVMRAGTCWCNSDGTCWGIEGHIWAPKKGGWVSGIK